jgi:hypothetical protein
VVSGSEDGEARAWDRSEFYFLGLVNRLGDADFCKADINDLSVVVGS